MFLRLTGRGPLPVLEKVLSYTEARQRVLAENIANVDTPGYRTKRLDPRLFQQALREALARRQNDPETPLRLPRTKQFFEGPDGRLHVTPVERPPENLLFHDGTNQRIEQQMTDLAENALMHQVAVELLQSQYRLLMEAIRGRL